jgi:hypothetical protein
MNRDGGPSQAVQVARMDRTGIRAPNPFPYGLEGQGRAAGGLVPRGATGDALATVHTPLRAAERQRPKASPVTSRRACVASMAAAMIARRSYRPDTTRGRVRNPLAARSAASLAKPSRRARARRASGVAWIRSARRSRRAADQERERR